MPQHQRGTRAGIEKERSVSACMEQMRRSDKLTLENMCVTGLVILILSSPATHSKKPNTPVTKLPHANTRPFHSGELSNVVVTVSSCSSYNLDIPSCVTLPMTYIVLV